MPHWCPNCKVDKTQQMYPISIGCQAHAATIVDINAIRTKARKASNLFRKSNLIKSSRCWFRFFFHSRSQTFEAMHFNEKGMGFIWSNTSFYCFIGDGPPFRLLYVWSRTFIHSLAQLTNRPPTSFAHRLFMLIRYDLFAEKSLIFFFKIYHFLLLRLLMQT